MSLTLTIVFILATLFTIACSVLGIWAIFKFGRSYEYERDDPYSTLPKGKTILEVAIEEHVEIPTLCNYKALDPYGACRLCTVEIKDGKRTKMVSACTFPVKEGIEVEKKAAKKAKELIASSTPTEWNKRHCGRAVVLILCCLFLSGCFRFYVSAREYKPVIEAPPAPKLEDTTTPFSEREQKIVKWAEQLEAALKEYNEWAASNNKQNGYSD